MVIDVSSWLKSLNLTSFWTAVERDMGILYGIGFVIDKLFGLRNSLRTICDN
jgi:hypothetical protein